MLDWLRLQDNGIPIYVQLRAQILQAIGKGMLPPGSQLPTMRQTAVALRIDLNTVQRAYASLEREGILTTTRGRGTFVVEAPPPRNRRAEIRAFAAEVAALAQAQGIGLEELTEALKKLSERAP